MAENKGHSTDKTRKPDNPTPPPTAKVLENIERNKAVLTPPVAPPETLPLAERMSQQKQVLLDMQKQLQLQLNGVNNQLFLITQLENPGKTMDPNTGLPVEAPMPPRKDPPDTI